VLANEHEAEVLTFLARRPLHTVIMAGWIRDNGMESSLNRGTFYACRNSEGELEGVALIGHITLIEAHSAAALAVFATVAQQSSQAHVIMAEHAKIKLFWRHYAEGGQRPRLLCRELLFEQRWPVEVRQAIDNLRLAALDDLGLVMRVQARMAFEESGVDPMETDPQGFSQRCARRIEQGRVWVWVEHGRLIFKADVLASTPEVNYLEGVWVNPQDRGRGYGLRCLSQMGRTLLTKTNAIAVLVNERLPKVQAFYRRAGFHARGYYETIYLQR
jgi:GNAT superfamily N-acetyltransferase